MTEREAVVAFLRARAAQERPTWAEPWLEAAAAIERGEHMKLRDGKALWHEPGFDDAADEAATEPDPYT